MKNIIKLFKSTFLNKKGKVSANVMAGLSAAVFVTAMGYSVYNAYNSSPSYNPAAPANYKGEDLNLSANNLPGGGVDFENSDPAFYKGEGRSFYADVGVLSDPKNAKNQAAKEQASFDAARAYIDSQKAWKTAGVNTATGGDVYNPLDSTYELEDESLSVRANSSERDTNYGLQQFQATKQAVNGKAVKEAQSKEGKTSPKIGAQTARQSTQINKLAASGGSSAFGNSGAGAARGGAVTSSGVDSSSVKGDNSTRALPQTKGQSGTGEGEAFKFGRAGTMGGFNVSFDGRAGGEGKGRGIGGAMPDLQMAAAYSAKATASSHEAGQKSLADAAFDGSNPENLTPTIPENATISRTVNALLDGSKGNLPKAITQSMNDLINDINETKQKTEEFKELENKLNTLKWATLIGALALSIGISFLKNIPVHGLWIAGVVVAIGVLLVTGMGLWMKDVVDQMADQKFKAINRGVDFVGKYNLALKIPILSGALIFAGLTDMWKNTWNSITSIFKKKAATTVTKVAAEQVVEKTAGGFANAIKNFSNKLSLKGFGAFRGILEKIFPTKRG